MSNLKLFRKDLARLGILLDTEKSSNFYILKKNSDIEDEALIPQLDGSFSGVHIEDLLPLSLNSSDFLALLIILKKYLGR